jgi:hypothetical protein
MQHYMHDGPAAFRFEVAGSLDANDAARLEQDWRTASSTIGNRALIVDLSFVTAIDEAAQTLLQRWHAGGAQLVANTAASRELVQLITGSPFSQQPQKPTYEPWYSLSLKSLPVTPLLGLLTLLTPSALNAAQLQPETLSAWNEYVRSADAAMQDRLRPGNPFLWADETPDRRRHVRSGEILVTAVGEHNPQKVPTGLIHDWMGAVFLPETKLEDVLGVVRDYAHYKDYYNPSVVDSRTIQQGPATDRFSMLLMNQALFLKTALENECESHFVQAGQGRWYSTSSTVRVQEIEGYRQPNEHKLAPDEGSGYIWRLHSIARYEERDGGVYIEIEAIALSRDIPAAVRWAVDPIVRRVSRTSLTTSLRQTRDAVGSSGQAAAAGKPIAIPTFASGFAESQH